MNMVFKTIFTLAALCFASVALADPIENAIELQDESIHMKRDPCGLTCRFRWCRTNENFTLAPSGRVLNLRRDMLTTNPFVCLPGGNMARVLKTGQVKLQNDDGSFTFLKDIPTPSYIGRFFRTAPIAGLLVGGARRSGLKLTPATAEQFIGLDNKCVILPIRQFERYDPVTETVGGRSRILTRDIDCVSFRSFAPFLHVFLYWESSDDLDLIVEEPDGGVLDRLNQKTATGRFTNDNGAGACIPTRTHHEAAVYRREMGPPQSGTYKVTVRMSRNCDPSTRIRYALRVYNDGMPIFQKRMFTRNADGTTVFTTTFTYP